MKLRELTLLTKAVTQAGRYTLNLARDGFDIHHKPDGSPVTSADLAVNEILHQALVAVFPDDGWLSEETPDSSNRLGKKRVWVIDPIDGTSAFVKKVAEFCISAALVESGHPVVAVIFNPSTDELFSAVRGGGLHLNGQPVRPEHAHHRPTILVSASELRAGRFRETEGQAVCQPIGSIAYALALVAANRADAAMTFEPENEWDVAAGTLLIEEGGGRITDGSGKPFRFNQPHPRFSGTVGLSPLGLSRLRSLVVQLQQHP